MSDAETRKLAHDVATVFEMLNHAETKRGDDLLLHVAMAIGAHKVLRIQERINDFLREPAEPSTDSPGD